MKNIATGDVLERIRRLAPSHVTAPFKTVAEWREWQLSEGQKRCEEINRQNRQLRVEKILNRSGRSAVKSAVQLWSHLTGCSLWRKEKPDWQMM